MTHNLLSRLSLIAVDVLPVRHAKIAAAIVYKGEMVAIGICSYKSHPFQKRYGRNAESIFLHAEIDAINKALKRGYNLRKCDLYIARVKRPYAFASHYVPGLAKPCDGCMKAIMSFGIRHVYYTE